MSVASALVVGNDALPALAEEAFRRALARTAERQANGVLMFLTPDFSRDAQRTVTAVARAARCIQLAGGIAAGVFTESGWVLDRPAAAVMVFAGHLALGHREAVADSVEPNLSYAGSHFPCAWGDAREKHFGGSFAGHPGHVEPVAWQQSRLAGHCSVQLFGTRIDIGVSRGWRLLGEPSAVDSSRAYDLLRLGGQSALDQLLRSLPVDHRRQAKLPLASLCAFLIDNLGSVGERLAFDEAACHPIAIIAANPDKSLTLAERVVPGQRLAWAMRTPQSTAADMHRSVERLAVAVPDPAAAIMFSCIGRGPYFYGGEDHDVDCIRRRFPGLPLIGSYGTGQIAPRPGCGSRLLQNAVVTALISTSTAKADVQSQS
ncbi:FIST C-terminal domain-containing protein [Accumulibacter sp.]|jgi:small ligand-binding sensory domain FIST|uniref:FIST C-terminal domain-containing protein n=1 Tax=Accumulibacter sp. TaxID=2053492 RepID=UPI002CC31487|nr:FIST C-terminal domain-containing protein [Accumulibacter sp.]HPU80035.1 FIST C-terminal domain-containing protein [Accumulibacter sp.]